MHDARIQRALALEAHVREYLEHLPILAEHFGLEFRDSVGYGDESQMFEQQRADAAPLELFENCECDFCAIRLGAANVTTDAEKALAPVLSQRRSETDVILEI